MSQIKVAIVGTGKVTRGQYLPALVAETDVSLGYYNRSRDKADVCAAQFGGQVFGSITELLDWQPDTVLVLTRETQRLAAGEALLEPGRGRAPRRIFFEKPLVAANGQENVTEQDFADGRRILRQAEAAGCETAMVFNYRFFEHSAIARRIAAERDFGAVRNVTGLVHYACWSHSIDLVHFFAGPIAQITALQGQSVRAVPAAGGMSARDVAVAFRTQDDASGTLIGTTSLAWTFPLFKLDFNFERGRIQMQDLDGEMTVMDSRGIETQTFRIAADRSRWNQYNDSFGKSLRAYLQSIRDQQPPPVPGRFGLLELQVEAAIKRSIAQAQPVTLAEAFPLD